MRASVLLVALGLGFATSVAAGAADDARQWPLSLPDAEAGLYRVELGPDVYRAALSPRLDDVDVLDGQGRPVPAQLLAARAPVEVATVRSSLPWFPLPGADAGRGGDLALVVERATDGSVVRVDVRMDADATAPAASTSWLVDASAMRGSIDALVLDWREAPSPLEATFRIEGSDDLRQWRVLQSSAVLFDLHGGGLRLRRDRLPVGAAARYLRLVPLSGAGRLVVTKVEAERGEEPARVGPVQWLDLEGRPGAGRDAEALLYELDGRFPVESVDVSLAAGATAQWRLYSRDEADAPWVERAGPWLGFRIGDERSPPQPLARPLRDRYWKLEAMPAPARPPVLRLGWRPESLVFVAGDAPPFRVVAGSARAVRGDAPVARSLEAVRSARGADWQPPLATLGQGAPLAGDAALRPARDWTTWMLWGLLVAGAAMVAAMAFRLLRGPRD